MDGIECGDQMVRAGSLAVFKATDVKYPEGCVVVPESPGFLAGIPDGIPGYVVPGKLAVREEPGQLVQCPPPATTDVEDPNTSFQTFDKAWYERENICFQGRNNRLTTVLGHNPSWKRSKRS